MTFPNADLEPLVQDAQQGDTDAFARLYDRFVDDIYRYVVVRVEDHMEAEDIASRTFRKAWDYLPHYRSRNFRAFLYTIAHNLIIDHYRYQKKRKSQTLIETLVDPKAQPDQLLEKQEQRQDLHRAIQALAPGYQDIIMLRFIEQLSIKETAQILKRSSISIRVGQYKALRKLKQLLSS